MNRNHTSVIGKTISAIGLFLILTNSGTIYGQYSFDTSKIETLLVNCELNLDSITVDDKVIEAIRAVDVNINGLVRSQTTYVPKKITLIHNSKIKVRKLVGKDATLKIVLKDTIPSNNLNYWKSFQRDTIKFLSDLLIKENYELHYPDYQYPQEIAVINPLTIKQGIHLNHLLFFNDHLNPTIDSIAKKMNRKERSVFYKYISDNFDYFLFKRKKVYPKEIEIKTITFSQNQLVYVGIDIYGSHYQLSFDANKNWSLEEVKELWNY